MTILVVLCLMVSACLAQAAPVPFQAAGYTISVDVMLPVSPERAFDMMTSDIGGWWDHTVSDYPKRLYLEPRPGGGFYEIFDDAGNGVQHAVVTYAERGKRLRMEGPLGLAGQAIQMVTTWDYQAAGDSTRVLCTVNLSGQTDAAMAGTVDGVWQHLLIEQLKPWAEARK